MFSKAKNFAIWGGEYHAHVNDHLPGNEGFNVLHPKVMYEAFHDALARIYFPRCEGETHTAALKEIRDWINAPMDRKSPVMWLNGNPNTRVSIVAQTIADQCSDAKILLASFFFSGSDDTQTHSLFPTLAYQITTKVPGMRSVVGQAVENDPLIFQRAPDIQMQSLIMEPLAATGCDLSTLPHLIIIDGLEICSAPMQQKIIFAISDALRRYDLPLTFLISSLRSDSMLDAFKSYLEMKDQSYACASSIKRLSFHKLTMQPHPTNSLLIQTSSLPGVNAHATHSTPRSPTLSRSPTTGRIPIVDNSIPTKLKHYKRPPSLLRNSSVITCTKLSPNGHTLLIGLADGTLRVWDATNGTLKSEYRCYPLSGMVVDVAYSTSSYLKYLFVLQDNTHFTTSICAVLRNRSVVTVAKDLPPLSHVHVLANGTIVAFCCLQGRVLLKSWKISKHGGISWDKGVTLSELTGLRDHPPDIFMGCAFLVSPAEKTFWTATKTGSIFSSEVENGHEAYEVLQLAERRVRPSISSAHTYAGYPRTSAKSTSSYQTNPGSSIGPPQANPGTRPTTIIPLYPSTSLPTHFSISTLNSGPLVRLACSPDQRKLAVSFASGEILLWDITLRHPKIMREASLTTHRMLGASPITFSTDGRYLIYACNDLEKFITVQDIATTIISDSIFLEECPDDNDITFISAAKDFKHIIVSFKHCDYALLFRWA